MAYHDRILPGEQAAQQTMTQSRAKSQVTVTFVMCFLLSLRHARDAGKVERDLAYERSSVAQAPKDGGQ